MGHKASTIAALLSTIVLPHQWQGTGGKKEREVEEEEKTRLPNLSWGDWIFIPIKRKEDYYQTDNLFTYSCGVQRTELQAARSLSPQWPVYPEGGIFEMIFQKFFQFYFLLNVNQFISFQLKCSLREILTMVFWWKCWYPVQYSTFSYYRGLI